MGFASTIVRDALVLSPGFVSLFAGGLAINVVLGVYLSPEAMGTYSLFWAAQTYAATAGTGWLRNAALRYLPEDRARLVPFVRLALVTVAVLAAAAAVVIALGLALFGGMVPAPYLLWTGLILVAASLFTLFQSCLRAIFDKAAYSVAQVALDGSKLGLLLVLLPRDADPVRGALMALALSHLPVLVWQGHKMRRLLAQARPAGAPAEPARDWLQRSLHYGVPLNITLFASTFLQTGDRYFLATMIDLHRLGLYSFWMLIGIRAAQGMYMLFFMALNPRLFEMLRHSQARATAYVRASIHLYIAGLLPLLTVLGFVLPLVLEGLRIRAEYMDAAHLVFFGHGVAFFLGLAQLSGKQREFAGDTRVIAASAVISVSIAIGMLFVLTPRFGLPGAGSATLLGFVLHFVIVATASRRWPHVLAPALAVTVSAGLVALHSVAEWAWNDFAAAAAMLLAMMLYLGALGLLVLRMIQGGSRAGAA